MNRASLLVSSSLLCLAAAHASAQATTAVPNSGIVMDERTGLIWQRNAVRNLDHDGAVAYCESLTLAGATDWRLPTKDELIAGFKVLPPGEGFAQGQTFLLWSSTQTRGGAVLVFRNLNTPAGTIEREKAWKPSGVTIGARCVRQVR